MPIYHFECAKCSRAFRVLMARVDGPYLCLLCGEEMVRQPSAPTTQVKEVLDNGAMTKSLERYADAEFLFKERAGK